MPLPCPNVWLFAPAKLSAITPHTVQDNGEHAGDGYLGTGHAAVLGDFHAQARNDDHLLQRWSRVLAAS